MKLGVFIVLFGDLEFTEAVEYAKKQGVEAIEIATGGYVGQAHCKPGELLQDKKTFNEFKNVIEQSGLEVSNLSCHGNPLHPNPEIAERDHQDFEDTVKLAQALGIETVVTFSGCPGDSENAKYPNWITCAWPPDHPEVLQWQWREKVIPYWKEQSEFCKQHGVRVAIEAHPGFVVYNNETAIRLREETGDNIGVCFDPSHLFWQGMDPDECIKELNDAIFHVHAKDTAIDQRNTSLNGVLDSKPYGDELNRSWIFRTIGYGNGAEVWKSMISTLTKIGYNGVISIEHEDSLMSGNEGFKKAAEFLNGLLIKEKAGEMWWA